MSLRIETDRHNDILYSISRLGKESDLVLILYNLSLLNINTLIEKVLLNREDYRFNDIKEIDIFISQNFIFDNLEAVQMLLQFYIDWSEVDFNKSIEDVPAIRFIIDPSNKKTRKIIKYINNLKYMPLLPDNYKLNPLVEKFTVGYTLEKDNEFRIIIEKPNKKLNSYIITDYDRYENNAAGDSVYYTDFKGWNPLINQNFDMVMIDNSYSSNEFFEILEILQSKDPSITQNVYLLNSFLFHLNILSEFDEDKTKNLKTKEIKEERSNENETRTEANE